MLRQPPPSTRPNAPLTRGDKWLLVIAPLVTLAFGAIFFLAGHDQSGAAGGPAGDPKTDWVRLYTTDNFQGQVMRCFGSTLLVTGAGGDGITSLTQAPECAP